MNNLRNFSNKAQRAINKYYSSYKDYLVDGKFTPKYKRSGYEGVSVSSIKKAAKDGELEIAKDMLIYHLINLLDACRQMRRRLEHSRSDESYRKVHESFEKFIVDKLSKIFPASIVQKILDRGWSPYDLDSTLYELTRNKSVFDMDLDKILKFILNGEDFDLSVINSNNLINYYKNFTGYSSIEPKNLSELITTEYLSKNNPNELANDLEIPNSYKSLFIKFMKNEDAYQELSSVLELISNTNEFRDEVDKINVTYFRQDLLSDLVCDGKPFNRLGTDYDHVGHQNESRSLSAENEIYIDGFNDALTHYIENLHYEDLYDKLASIKTPIEVTSKYLRSENSTVVSSSFFTYYIYEVTVTLNGKKYMSEQKYTEHFSGGW